MHKIQRINKIITFEVLIIKIKYIMFDMNIDVKILIYICVFIVLIILGIWEGIDYLFIEECLKSETLLVPEIKLVIRDNQVDTIYIYKLK